MIRFTVSTCPVKVIESRALHLQGPSGDVISKGPLRTFFNTQKSARHARKNDAQGFVIDADSHIAVLNELVNGEQCIVRLSKKKEVSKQALSSRISCGSPQQRSPKPLGTGELKT